MHAEHIEGVIIADFRLHECAEDEANRTATKPRTIDPIGPAKPDAGVIATRPATAPEIMPSRDGLPLTSHSVNIQPSVAAAVATKVFTKAERCRAIRLEFEPALKPNQPTHRREAPIIDMVME